ncbi:MAG: O-antigen ligase family protein [Phenylobacterium sp.]
MKRAKRATDQPVPLLKPYSGAGMPDLHRWLVIGIAALAALICLPYGFYYALLTPWLLVPLVVPILMLAAVTIWALPDLSSFPDRTMECMLFVLFAALVAWPNYLALTFPGLPWITVTRLVGTPMVVLLLISFSGSAAFRTELSAVLKNSPAVWRCVAIFTILQGVSIVFAAQVGVAISQFVVHITNETAAFFLCAYLFRRPGRAELWGSLFWLFAIFAGLIGIEEFRLEKVIWAGHVPSFLLPRDEVVAHILQGSTRATTGDYRAQSVYSTSLGLSEMMALAIPFPLHFMMQPRYNVFVRLAGAASIPFMVIVILDSGSRLGLLGFFLGTMLYLAVWAFRMRRKNPSSLVATAVIVAYPVLFSAFIVASLTIGRIKARVWGMGQYDDSNQARIDQWNLGIPKILTHPLGYGPGQGAPALGYHNLGGTLTIDSYYLSVAMDYGLVGLVAFIAVFGVGAFQGGRHAIALSEEDPDVAFLLPLTVALISFMAMKSFFAQDDNNAIAFMMVGTMVGLIHRMRSRNAAAEGKLKTVADRRLLAA